MALINEMFSDPRKALYAAKAGLNRTDLGRAGAVRVEQEATTGKIFYISAVSGKRFETAEQAFLEASNLLLTNYTELGRGATQVGQAAFDTRFSQAGVILENIQNALAGASVDQKKRLEKIGLGGLDADSLKLRILTTKGEGRKGATATAKELEKLGIGFIPVVDSEGGAYLAMKGLVGGEEKNFTSAQMHMMSSILGSSMLSADVLQDKLGKEAMPGFVNKLPKRLRAFFSERDVMISEEDILKSLGSKPIGKDISENILRVDSGIDYLKKYFDFETRTTGVGGQSFTTRVRGVDYNLLDELLNKDIVQGTIENVSGTGVDRTILNSRDIKGLIQESNSSKELLDKVEEAFGKSSQEYESVNKIVTGVKREFDGISVVSDRLLTHKMGQLEAAKYNLEERITETYNNIKLGVGGSTRADAEALEEQLYKLNRQYDIISNAKNTYQVTLRGGIGEEQIKSAANFVDFDQLGPDGLQLFSRYAAILDEEALKKELGFSFKGLIISGLGSGGKEVYADPVSTAFHPELFATDYDIENIKRYSGEIMQELNESVNQSILPAKIKEMLNKTLYDDSEFEFLPEYMTETRARNKQFAREILELHQSGISPRESPRMMNMLQSLYASEMYTVQRKNRIDTYLPTLPDVRRFAASTESAADQGGTAFAGERLGKTMVRMQGATEEISANLLSFRTDKGRLLFGPGMVNSFYESLGGFDLDDKVLTKMMTYKDNGNKKRLLFGVYRQPSGPEEIMYAKAHLDEGTLRSFFQDERFRGLLQDYKQSNFNSPNAASLDELYSVLWENKKYTTLNRESAEDIIVSIFDFAESRGKAGLRHLDAGASGVDGAHNRRILRSIERFGSSSLENNQNYTRDGIIKIFTQEGAYNKEEGFLIKDQLGKLLKNKEYSSKLDSLLVSRLETAIEKSDYGTISSILSSNKDNYVLKALKENAVFSKMFDVATAEVTSSLGTYVNRSMVVGSRMNQTQDLIEFLMKRGQEGRIKKILEHQIGLLSQETAIDFTKAAAGVMPVLETLDKAKEELKFLQELIGHSTDLGAARSALEKIYKNKTLGAIGDEAMSSFGKRIGSEYAQVMEYATELAITDSDAAEEFKKRFLPKIDKQLFYGRTQTKDVESIISGVVEGIRGSATNVDNFKDIIEQISGDKFPTDPEQQRTKFLEQFGADAHHMYSSLERMNRAGIYQASAMEAQNALRMRSRVVDPSLAAFEYTENARRAADYLLEKHFEEASKIENFFAETDLSRIDTDKLYQRKLQMGERVTEEIKEAAKRSGVSLEEMINTLEKRSAQTGKNSVYESLSYFTRSVLGDTGSVGVESNNLRTMIGAARIKRKFNYNKKLLESSEVVESLALLGETSPGKLTQRAREVARSTFELSEFISKSGLELEESLSRQLDILTLLSEDADLAEKVFYGRDAKAVRAKLIDRVEAIRSHSRYQELADEFKDPGTAFTSPASVTSGPTSSKVAKDLDRVIAGEEVSTSSATFKRIGEFIKDGSLRKLFEENKTFRNSTYAIGALIAGSFIYDRLKDRSPEDIQGPPLLPGGSAYEEDYPKRMAEIPEVGQMMYNPGVSYKVNLYGDRRDVDNFKQQAMGLGKFNMNTTMYRRAPELGKNPYQQVASSF